MFFAFLSLLFLVHFTDIKERPVVVSLEEGRPRRRTKNEKMWKRRKGDASCIFVLLAPAPPPAAAD